MDFCDLTRVTVARDKNNSLCSLLFLQSAKLWHLCHALQGLLLYSCRLLWKPHWRFATLKEHAFGWKNECGLLPHQGIK